MQRLDRTVTDKRLFEHAILMFYFKGGGESSRLLKLSDVQILRAVSRMHDL